MTDALLLVTSACPHCPAMIKVLGELVKEGAISRLEVVNIVHRPEVASDYGVRSVPWMKLGDMEFSGAMTRTEIEQWIELTEGQSDAQAALTRQLKAGALNDVVTLAHKQPNVLPDLISVLSGAEVPLTVRIGISAVVESFEDKPEQLIALMPDLGRLTTHDDPATRADGCHFLGLTHDEGARPWLEACLDDGEEMVREVAEESLNELSGA